MSFYYPTSKEVLTAWENCQVALQQATAQINTPVAFESIVPASAVIVIDGEYEQELLANYGGGGCTLEGVIYIAQCLTADGRLSLPMCAHEMGHVLTMRRVPQDRAEKLKAELLADAIAAELTNLRPVHMLSVKSTQYASEHGQIESPERMLEMLERLYATGLAEALIKAMGTHLWSAEQEADYLFSIQGARHV